MRKAKKSKLSEAQVLAIFSHKQSANSNQRLMISEVARLSNLYQVTTETIYNIWRGRTWGIETGMVHKSKSLTSEKNRPVYLNIVHIISIDDQLYNWTRLIFIHKRLFLDDSIDGLEN